MLGVYTSLTAKTINLATNGARVVGKTYFIFDKTGNAGSVSTINGSHNKIINSNYNSFMICCIDVTSGSEKWIII